MIPSDRGGSETRVSDIFAEDVLCTRMTMMIMNDDDDDECIGSLCVLSRARLFHN